MISPARSTPPPPPHGDSRMVPPFGAMVGAKVFVLAALLGLSLAPPSCHPARSGPPRDALEDLQAVSDAVHVALPVAAATCLLLKDAPDRERCTAEVGIFRDDLRAADDLLLSARACRDRDDPGACLPPLLDAAARLLPRLQRLAVAPAPSTGASTSPSGRLQKEA